MGCKTVREIDWAARYPPEQPAVFRNARHERRIAELERAVVTLMGYFQLIGVQIDMLNQRITADELPGERPIATEPRTN